MKKIFLAIMILLLLCSTTFATTMTSESEGEMEFSVTLPENAQSSIEYLVHVETGDKINYDRDGINTPTDLDAYKGEIEPNLSISGEGYECRAEAKVDEMKAKSKVGIDDGKLWAYSMGIVYYTIIPTDDYLISFEGEFKYEIELESEGEDAGAFACTNYSIWIGSNIIDECFVWEEIIGEDDYRDDGKQKFKFKNYDLEELGQADEYILLFIVDSYSHADMEPPEGANMRGFMERHADVIERIEPDIIRRSKDKGCFIGVL